MPSHLNELELCGIFLKLNNGLGQVAIQFKKSLHKSNSFRRESISKLSGGQPMNVFLFFFKYLWSVVIISDLATFKCSHALTSWNCSDFFLTGQVFIKFKKSLHKSDSFGHESISKLPGLI
jgi:hypothetical protein